MLFRSMTQTESTIAVVPCCQLPPTSFAAKDSGRKTDLMPWVIHFNGNIEATCCIQWGSWSNIKKTPLINCRTKTIGVTTADAPLPLLGTEEKAIPSNVELVIPSNVTQIKVIQCPMSVGILISKASAPTTRRDRKSTRLNSSHTDISRMPSSA